MKTDNTLPESPVIRLLCAAWGVAIGTPRLESRGIDHGYVAPGISNDDAVDVSIGFGIMALFGAAAVSGVTGQTAVLLAIPAIPAAYLQLASTLAARRFDRDQASGQVAQGDKYRLD